MKVLFIHGDLCGQAGFNHGIAHLSAALKEAGHQALVITANKAPAGALTDDELLTRINAEKPGLVGFSAGGRLDQAIDLAKKVRRAFPHIPRIVGGAYATADPRGALAAGVFDYACVGEGEEALVELAEALAAGREATGIAGIWTWRDGAVLEGAPRGPVDLLKLPPKDYGICDFQAAIDESNGWAGLQASRGRPAVGAGVSGGGCWAEGAARQVRWYPVASVIDDVRHILGNYTNVRGFQFEDEILTLDKKHLRELVAMYRQVTQLPFTCNSHVKCFDAETARILADGGCRTVSFELGAGAARVRAQETHCEMTDAEIDAAFGSAGAAGLHTSAAVVVGALGETVIEMDETVRLVGRIAPGRFRWTVHDGGECADAAKGARGGGAARLKRELQVKKLSAAYPWYVNARSADPLVRRLYSRLIRVVDGLDEEMFGGFEGEVPRLDALLHQVLVKAGRVHYSLRYDECTGVISTWND